MRARAGAEEGLRHHTVQMADARVVRVYVKDLRGFVENSGIVERKAFLKSFLERLEVEPSQVTVTYTTPVWSDKSAPLSEAVGVLPLYTQPHQTGLELFQRHTSREPELDPRSHPGPQAAIQAYNQVPTRDFD